MRVIQPGDEERRTVVQKGVLEHPTSGKSICALLVSFHPDPDLPDRVSRILAQVGALMIVDNGSGEAALRMLQELSADSRISLELNRRNLGVARALNIGIERARSLGYEWVLLLDQDSVVNAGLVDELIAVHASFPEPARLAALGAGFRDVHKPETELSDSLETLWEDAGGSHGEAFTAAEIAMAESGGQQFAHSPTNDFGYWQINGVHGPSEATYDPMGNAKAAIEISDNGRNWSPWTTYTSGAYHGRC